MDDDICAMFKRPGLDRRGISIVDHGFRAMTLGDRADRGDVDQAHVRIGRGLEIDHFRVIRDGRFQGQRIGQVDMRHRHAKPAEPVLEE